MKIFYEKLTDSVEQYYNNKSTLENILYLEDIIKNINRDIYVQYKKKTNISLSYASSNINVDGIIKCRNHIYFINNYKSTYNSFLALENNKENKVKILIYNSNISGGQSYKIKLYLNNVQIEQLEYTNEYDLYNKKAIKIYSQLLGTYIEITWPLYLNQNDYIEYTVYTIYVTEEPALHKFLCIYDKSNNALILDKKYLSEEINCILQSNGSILRASTINDLYTLNSQSFVQYDESLNKLTITQPKLYKEGTKLKYIKSQTVEIDPNQLNIGYSLLGIYINEDYLLYDSILSNTSYSVLLDQINNYYLDTLRKERTYYGFIIGINNITKFTPLDIQLYNSGAGGSGTGGSVNKVSYDFTNADELTITYNDLAPLVYVYNEDGNQIIPENVHYNNSDEITITFGENITGKVTVI